MRAVFYCRVSTDEASQLNALEDQVQEAKKCIGLLGWELAGGYIDEGKSGTSTKKRNEYKRLFEDLSSDKFDILVIKSQDRLMRNTKEWYIFIDALVKNKKKLYIYIERKFYTPDDALLTGIKAILAEEYSRELSKKIRNAHKNRQEKGTSILITSATWGYDKINKEVVINAKEAEIVRIIFELCIQGYGSRRISKMLSEQGIYSRTGGYFPEVTIRKIIRNPLFKGTAVMNRKSVDFNTKATVVNSECDWKIHDNAVPAIVTPEIWGEANKKMDERSERVGTEDFRRKKIGRNKGHYELSSKIFCGMCGSVYWRRYRRLYKNDEEITVDWSCSEYVKRGRKRVVTEDKVGIQTETVSGCNNIHMKEIDLLDIMLTVAESILKDNRELVMKQAMNILKDVLNNEEIREERVKRRRDKEKIKTQKNILLDKLLDGTINDEDYKRKNSELENKLNTITENEKTASKECVYANIHDRLKDIEDELDKADFNKARMSKLIRHVKKITIFEKRLEIDLDFCDKLTVDFHGKSV